MTRAKATAQRSGQAAFWDTSAIVPLCCFQNNTSLVRNTARIFARQVVWWATPVEATGAMQRLLRDGHLDRSGSANFIARLEHLRSHWSEVQPSDALRELAERLLAVHRLRSADALQLAASLIWCSNRPRGRHFISGDNELLQAAALEGFSIVHL